MTCWLTLFGGADYEETTAITLERAPKLGVGRVLVYDDFWLDAHPFRKLNAHLWETAEQRGYGWHAWKPLLAIEAMRLAADGDVVGYVDADTYPAGPSLLPLYAHAERDGACLFDCSGRVQREWCQRDAFIALGQDEARYWNAEHGCARFGFWKKGDWRAEQFLMEWLVYCVNPLANTRQGRPSKYGAELPGFVEHRTDQAIYTLLAHRYGYKLHPEASEGPGRYFTQQHSTKGSPTSNGRGSRFRNVEMPR
jgi:hypothetical protein